MKLNLKLYNSDSNNILFKNNIASLILIHHEMQYMYVQQSCIHVKSDH